MQPHKIQVETVKQGLFKHYYSFTSNGEVLASLLPKSFGKKAIMQIGDKEYTIRRRHGILKNWLEVTSPTDMNTVEKIQLRWSYKFSITDSAGNQFHFKPTGWWNRKWIWSDRMNSSIAEITTKYFSKKNRGAIEIKRHEMQDWLYWIVLSWFVVISSESDAAVVAAT